ncbi:DUF4124 domain-containing protein [Uliginosibacterium sp. 31-16]|uniref:DUF4124 domain-containing protein n=1 Tax=Uliginosibacterium sp. 31-16 TaxID=3068315 RepID=UPI00273D4A34|nr:DUF4124 domain-containing protein [Uliginosibacterium sp. 31-16]MDP5239762.1 DUF4124 domain-containing protein [Uliginosibacterium sp. 31-16]
MKRSLLLIVLCACALSAQAEIYKWVDADGKIQYGDVPPKGTQTKKVSGGVTVVPAIVVPPPAPAEPAAPRKSVAKDEAGEVRGGGISPSAEASEPADTRVSDPRAERRKQLIEQCQRERRGNCENEADNQLNNPPVVIPGWNQPPIRPAHRPVPPPRPQPAPQQSEPAASVSSDSPKAGKSAFKPIGK